MTSGGLDLTGPEADQLLRPAAELAIEVAQASARQQPPLDVPRALRPLLGHARVTRAALATARRVVEADPEFRARVATALEVAGAETALGPAGVLWLRRPDGWEAELGSLLDQARATAAAEEERTLERSAQRRLRHAEQARERAERAAEEARTSSETAKADLQEERRLRRLAEEAAARAARQVAALDDQLASARRRADAATAQVAARGEAEAAAQADLAAAEGDLAELREQVAALRHALAERQAAAVPEPPPAASPLGNLRAVGEAVADASAAAVALGAALGRAAAALDPAEVKKEVAQPPDREGAHRPGVQTSTHPRWVRNQRRAGRRRPVRLPPFVLDDSPEAVVHLVSLPNVVVLVDGYNATLSTWPDLPLPEQRLRLIDALAELAARTGARPEVVFDGAETVAGSATATGARSLVKVSFTAHDVEADDVLIARARALPQPVVVASNDRRVRDGARSAGANVVGIDQLLAALRRRGT